MLRPSLLLALGLVACRDEPQATATFTPVPATETLEAHYGVPLAELEARAGHAFELPPRMLTAEDAQAVFEAKRIATDPARDDRTYGALVDWPGMSLFEAPLSPQGRAQPDWLFVPVEREELTGVPVEPLWERAEELAAPFNATLDRLARECIELEDTDRKARFRSNAFVQYPSFAPGLATEPTGSGARLEHRTAAWTFELRQAPETAAALAERRANIKAVKADREAALRAGLLALADS